MSLRLFAWITAAYAVLVACGFSTLAALFAAISGHPWPEIGFGLAAIATYRAYPGLDRRIDEEWVHAAYSTPTDQRFAHGEDTP